VVVIAIIGILASVIFAMNKTSKPSGAASDIATIKTALRQLELRSTSDLSGANWTLSGTASNVSIYNNGTLISSYDLSGTTGEFSAAFDQVGRLQTNQSIPASIYIEPETGYIP